MLAAQIAPVSIFAVVAYYHARYIQLVPATLIALGLIGGSLLGAEVALGLPGDTLQRLYGLFLIYVGWRFIEPRKLWAARHAAPHLTGNPPEEAVAAKRAPWYLMLGVGGTAGIASGLFGIGGGLVIVPALVGLLNYDQKAAVGTSLAAQLPPVAIGAVLSYYEAGKIDLPATLLVALGLIGGAFGGARLALGLPSTTIKRLYGAFLLLVSLRFIFQL